jgi:alpha-L-fucosidase
VITNDRWGRCRGVHGDVFESEYGGGDSCSPEHPWQEDRGMGRSYGYNRAENIEDYDSPATLIQMLVRCTANGGNYLLCVGPTGDGRIPVIMQQRLLEIGDWLKIHGEAIYGAQASPFWPRRFEWGYVSAQPGKLYLHTFDPTQTKVELTGLKNRIKAATILQHPDTSELQLTQHGQRLTLQWPAHFNNEAVTVISLDIEGEPDVSQTQHQFADGRVVLGCRALKIHGTKAHVDYRGYGQSARIVDWLDPNETVSATFDLAQPGTFDVRVTYSASPGTGATGVRAGQDRIVGSRFRIELGAQQFKYQAVSTGADGRFRSFVVGQVRIEKAGRHQLVIRPETDGWAGIGLQSIELTPASQPNREDTDEIVD